MPSRKSSEAKQDSRRAIRPASCCSLRIGEAVSRSIALLLPRIESGALAAISAAKLDRGLLESLVGDDFVDEADLGGAGGLEVAPGEEELLGAGEADRVEELAQAGVAVDEAELDRRHAELGAGGADPQVAGDRQLQAAADAVAVDRGDGRPGDDCASASIAAWKGWATSASASRSKVSEGIEAMS